MRTGACRIAECPRPVRCKALCALHYDQFQKGRPIREPPTLADRFWAKVDKRGPDECWPWLGNKTEAGYGRIRTGGQGMPTTGAHRISYELNIGPIPPGLDIMHACDNPSCVNPAHLSPGTDKDNAADKIAKGRGRWLRGNEHPLAKVSDEGIAAIRQLGAIGDITHAEIGRRFGLSQSYVTQLINHSKRPPRPEECDRMVGRCPA